MPSVVIKGWRPGLQTVSHMRALQEYAGLSLVDAKSITDAILEGFTRSVTVESIQRASELAAYLRELGAVAEVVPESPGTTMTPEQAYLAMFAFLDSYYRRGRSDEVAILLGAMSLLPDGQPADPAIALDWRCAVTRALSGEVNANQTIAR